MNSFKKSIQKKFVDPAHGSRLRGLVTAGPRRTTPAYVCRHSTFRRSRAAAAAAAVGAVPAQAHGWVGGIMMVGYRAGRRNVDRMYIWLGASFCKRFEPSGGVWAPE